MLPRNKVAVLKHILYLFSYSIQGTPNELLVVLECEGSMDLVANISGLL